MVPRNSIIERIKTTDVEESETKIKTVNNNNSLKYIFKFFPKTIQFNRLGYFFLAI